jgi:hypothetical protein
MISGSNARRLSNSRGSGDALAQGDPKTPRLKTRDRPGQVPGVLRGGLGDFQHDVSRRPSARFQNTLEHRAVVAGHPGDVPGVDFQNQEPGQRLPRGVDDVQGTHQPIQVDDGILIEGDGVGRPRRNAITARTESLKLGLMAQDLTLRIEQRLERAFQPDAVEPGHHRGFFEDEWRPRGGPCELRELLVKASDKLSERHESLLGQWRQFR